MLPLGWSRRMVNLMALAGSNTTKSVTRLSSTLNSRAIAVRLSAPLSRTRSKFSRSRQMMSNVMWSTPAFLLRMVEASSTSFMGTPLGSRTDRLEPGPEELALVLDLDDVVQRPLVRRARAKHFVRHDRGGAGRAFDVGQPGVEEVLRRDVADGRG